MTDLKQRLAKHKKLKRTWWCGKIKNQEWASSARYNNALSIAQQQSALIDELVGKLQAIKDHQGSLIKGMPHLSTTWYIADKALQSAKEAGYNG